VQIPTAAVQHVGQLDLVEVVAGDQLDRRLVRLGRTFEETVEVLSGLSAGERVAMPAASASTEASGHVQ